MVLYSRLRSLVENEFEWVERLSEITVTVWAFNYFRKCFFFRSAREASGAQGFNCDSLVSPVAMDFALCIC